MNARDGSNRGDAAGRQATIGLSAPLHRPLDELSVVERDAVVLAAQARCIGLEALLVAAATGGQRASHMRTALEVLHEADPDRAVELMIDAIERLAPAAG